MTDTKMEIEYPPVKREPPEDRASPSITPAHQLRFCFIHNQQHEEGANLKGLIDLKCILAKQLPKMPRDYIVKLLFDRHHQSVLAIDLQERVVGGIVFREFTQEKFAEIAFLAITGDRQIKGYGTKLMNHFKSKMVKRKLEFLMTYADNLALGYFRRQGFSKECRMPPERWKGCIKDYEGGTMMECPLLPHLDYQNLAELLARQKEHLLGLLKPISMLPQLYSAEALKYMPSFTKTNQDGSKEEFRVNPMDIPGVRQAGWSWKEHERLKQAKEVSYIVECQRVLRLMKKHPISWPFREPISLQDVPDYNLVIPQPIDLRTIEKKLNSSEYTSIAPFCEDVSRIFRNCRQYNKPDTEYWRCADELQDFIAPHLQSLKLARREDKRIKIEAKMELKREI